MKTLVLIFRGIVITILFASCSTNNYISQNATSSSDFEGLWQFRDHTDRTLQVTKIENNVYNLKFDSETNDWEGIGYEIGDELLAIFNYYYINQNGYITFNFVDKDKIRFQSMNSNGQYRSEGIFIRKE